MSESDMRHKWYLYDLGYLLKEYAQQAHAEYTRHKGLPDDDFYLGQMMAYHRVISLMQQQAAVFDIPLTDLRLENIDVEKDFT